MAERANRERWAILSGIDVGADGDPYLDRLRLIQTPHDRPRLRLWPQDDGGGAR
jgi:hypothetical protein